MVAKHGSRSSTGLSGSADVLEALGARIDLDAAGVGRCIEEIGFGFMFAPYHHPATGRVVKVRKELKVRTTFNFLGPLTNPAGASRQLLGVSDMATLPKMAGALALLGTRHALLVCSEDSLDELSISAATRVIEVQDGEIAEYTVIPEDFGLPRYPADAVPGGDPLRERPDRARDLRRRARRRARPRGAQRRRRDLRRRPRGDARRRRAAGTGGDRHRRRRRQARAFVALTNELSPQESQA